ncbi:hypothetical protein J6590_098302, partial [Homalodisca vitripennis]
KKNPAPPPHQHSRLKSANCSRRTQRSNNLAGGAGWRDRLRRLTAYLGLPFHTITIDISSRKLSQGIRVLDFIYNSTIANFWLPNQAAKKPGQFIDALKCHTKS